jgi:hypothetical protein
MMTVWSVSTIVITFVINVMTTFFPHVTHTLRIISTTVLAEQHTLCRFFRAFFLSCKAKKGHSPCSSQLGDNFYAVSSSLILVWPLWVRIPESFPTRIVNCVVLCIVCVYMYIVLLPSGINLIAVNKYININIPLCNIRYPVTSCLLHPHVALTTPLTTLGDGALLPAGNEIWFGSLA